MLSASRSVLGRFRGFSAVVGLFPVLIGLAAPAVVVTDDAPIDNDVDIEETVVGTEQGCLLILA